jgi:hypothetical protein
MSCTFSDPFTDADGTSLPAHTAPGGYTYSNHPLYAGGAVIYNPISGSARLNMGGTLGHGIAGLFFPSYIPTQADYNPAANILTTGGSPDDGIVTIGGRMSMTADTFYALSHASGDGAGSGYTIGGVVGPRWIIWKNVAGMATVLASSAAFTPLTPGQVYAARLRIAANSLVAEVDGVSILQATDSSITAAGRICLGTVTGSVGAKAGYYLDDLCLEYPVGPNTITSIISPGNAHNLLFGESDVSCKKALLVDYDSYTVQSGELIWAYQLVSDYCADWIEISPGLLFDPGAAAGSRTLNTSFGVRVYQGVVGSNKKWLHNTTGAPIGRGVPIVFPSWQSPVLVPWMGKKVNLTVEFYTNGDTIAAGAVLQLSVIPMQES